MATTDGDPTPRRLLPPAGEVRRARSAGVQRAADAAERDSRERYDRRRDFAALIADAARRAEAMTRLERALALDLR